MINLTICLFQYTDSLLDKIKTQKLNSIEILTNTKNFTTAAEFYNDCITSAKGKYITFVDDSDVFSADYFKILYLRAEQDSSDICKGTIYCSSMKKNIDTSKYTYIQPQFGTLYRVQFLVDNHITFETDNLDFSFYCTFLAKTITISKSAVYTHNGFRDLENKIRLSKDECFRFLRFFWSAHNFLFLSNISENIYLKVVYDLLNNFVLKIIEKTKITPEVHDELLPFCIFMYRSIVYTNTEISEVMNEIKNKCQAI